MASGWWDNLLNATSHFTHKTGKTAAKFKFFANVLINVYFKNDTLKKAFYRYYEYLQCF
jgi:hypothetical protein